MTHPIWPESMAHAPEPRPAGVRSAPRWCTCGAPWIDGRCGRIKERATLAPKRRLRWGLGAVSAAVWAAVVAALILGAWALLGVGQLWAALVAVLLLLVSCAVFVVGAASTAVALRSGRGVR